MFRRLAVVVLLLVASQTALAQETLLPASRAGESVQSRVVGAEVPMHTCVKAMFHVLSELRRDHQDAFSYIIEEVIGAQSPRQIRAFHRAIDQAERLSLDRPNLSEFVANEDVEGYERAQRAWLRDRIKRLGVIYRNLVHALDRDKGVVDALEEYARSFESSITISSTEDGVPLAVQYQSLFFQN